MEPPSIKKNYIYNMIYHLMTFFIPLITTPYLSRVLGAEGVGTFSFTVSIQTYFSMFTALGTTTYGARVIARNRDDKEKCSRLFWEIELLTICTAVVTLSIWLVLIIFNKEYRCYYAALTLCILGTMFDISWFFSGIEQYKYIALRNTFFKFLGIILLFVFVRDKEDLLNYFVLYSMTALLSSLSMWIKLKEYIIFVNFKELRLKEHLKETLIYFIPTIATSIYTVLDKTLIGLITKESAENGYYEQANQIINVAKTITFGSLNTVLGNRLSYLFAKNKIDEVKQKMSDAFDFVFLLGYGCVFGIIGIAENFVPIYFGTEFEPVIILLYVLSPIIIIISVSSCLGSQYYIPIGKRAQSAKYLIFGSCINLLLNLLLIPYLKSLGACLASLCAESFITILYLKGCDGFILLKELVDSSIKKIIAGLFMCICVDRIYIILAWNSKVHILVVQILCGILIYFILLFVMRDTGVKKLCQMLKKK